MARTSRRARALIDDLLKEMQRGLREPAHRKSDAWIEIYGSRQSLVVNLQKLVQALASLPDYAPPTVSREARGEAAEINAEEMALLTQWLRDTR